eukprot:SAG31_NODE_1505_length_8078_cov_5.291390_10_plen_56_part_01
MLWAEGGGEAMATVVGGESVDVTNEEPQNDGGGVPGTKISGTAGTAGTTGTAMYPD